MAKTYGGWDSRVAHQLVLAIDNDKRLLDEALDLVESMKKMYPERARKEFIEHLIRRLQRHFEGCRVKSITSMWVLLADWALISVEQSDFDAMAEHYFTKFEESGRQVS